METQQHSQGVATMNTQRQVLLITTVEIGNGRTENINVREGDNIYDVAHEFALKHGLPRDITYKLAGHLQENLEVQLKQQVAQGAHAIDDRAVFNRLYQQALELREKLNEQRTWVRDYELEVLKANKPSMTWVSMALMRDRSAGPFNNYGEMLYVENAQKMQMKQEKVQRLKEAFEARESANMTFKPQLSPRSRQLWSAVHEDKTPAWKRLSDGHAKTQDRFEQLRQEKKVQEEQSCTFKPMVSSKHDKLAQHAVQRYMAKSPWQGPHTAASATQSAPRESSTANNRSDFGTVAVAVTAGSQPQNVPGSTQRLYADAMRRMQMLQDHQEAQGIYKRVAVSTSSAGRTSSSGIHTATLKRAGLHRIIAAPGASITDSIGVFEASPIAPTANKAETAAVSMGSLSSTSGSVKRSAGINSCAGKLDRGRLSALGSINEIKYGTCGTGAGSLAATNGFKAQETSPRRASVAGGLRASMAGGLAKTGANSLRAHRRAWH